MNSEDEPSTSSDTSDLSEEFERRIEEIAEAYLNAIQANEGDELERLVSDHPDLSPHLEKRLRLVRAILGAIGSTDRNVDEGAPTSDDVLALENDTTAYAIRPAKVLGHQSIATRIECPHCGNLVQLVSNVSKELTEVTCRNCGSIVTLDNELTRPMTTELPGEIGRFEIKSLLGQGGFGSVFLAHDPNLDRQVARKVPRQGVFLGEHERVRFFREARHAARLNHPNIVKIHEVSDDIQTPYIVAEYIEGLTLSDLSHGGRLTFRDSAELMIEIAVAVHHAHQHSIIHRDLKPSNILVDYNNVPYVTDFGLARREDVEIAMTMEGVILGTPAYMSPEQASGHHSDVDSRSDVYALGVILYRLLCRELPFRGTKRMLIAQVIHDEPIAPRKLNATIPRDLETITLRAMAKSKAERFATANELADELRRWVSDKPVLSRPVSRLTRVWRWRRRHPKVAALSTALLASLLLMLTVSVVAALRENHLKNLAREIARIATLSEQKSNSRLYQLLMENGVNAMKRNKLTLANVWFSNALEFSDSAVNRRRIGMNDDQIPRLTTVFSSDGPIRNLEFSQNGTRLIAGSHGAEIVVTEVSSRKTIWRQQALRFSDLAVSHKGERVLTFGLNIHAELWDVDKKQLVKQLAHTDLLVSADFNHAQSKIVTGGYDSTLRIWELFDGELQHSIVFEGVRVNHVQFIPNSNSVVALTTSKESLEQELQIWDYELNRASALKLDSRVGPVVVSDDGKYIAAGLENGKIIVWDREQDNTQVQQLNIVDAVRDLVFDSSGEQLISVSSTGTVKSWARESGELIGIQVGASERFSVSAISPQRQLIALGNSNGSTRFYWRDVGITCSSVTNSDQVTALEFHPNSRLIAVGGDNGVVQIWDLAPALPDTLTFFHLDEVRNSLFSPDGTRCITTSMDGKAYIWDCETGKQLGAKMIHQDGIIECALSDDGLMFASCGGDGTVQVWDAFTGLAIGAPLDHPSPVTYADFDSSANRMVTGCSDGTVTCWDISRIAVGSVKEFVVKQDTRIQRVVFAPSDEGFVSVTYGGAIRYWNAESGSAIVQPMQHQPSAMYGDFFPDGKQFVSCGSDGLAIIWDLRTGASVQALPATGTLMNVKVSDDGQRVLVCELSGRVRVFQKQPNGQFSEARGLMIQGASTTLYSNENTSADMLVSCGRWSGRNSERLEDGVAVLWEAGTDRLLSPPLPHDGPVRRAYFDSKNRYLLTSSEDRTARLWKLKSTELPLNDLKRIGEMEGQMLIDTEGKISRMPPSMQVEEFASLSESFPDRFASTASERENWNQAMDRHQVALEIEKGPSE